MSPRRSDLVHDRLRRQILDGTLAPGDAVPSERVLAEQLEVNRHAVREALKRLQQAGLVRISQGGATRVQDWRDSGGLDLLLDLASQPEIPAELVRSVLEMRASIGIDAARRCAERADEGWRAEIVRRAAAAAGAATPAQTDERYADLWRAVVAGAENLAYRLALNSLNAALEAHAELLDIVRPQDPARISALGEAIAAREATAAADAARALLEP
jgi:DNA-binding FadR family transcriptional regulator